MRIIIKSPIEPGTAIEVVDKVVEYITPLVGGVAIVFFAASGILYTIGGIFASEGMIKHSKKAFWGGIVGLSLILLANTILQEIYYIVLGKDLDVNNLSAKEILMRLVGFLLSILGIIFLIMTIVGGSFYFAGGINESKIALGKKIFVNSIIGLVISLSGLIIVRQISIIISGS